uniref:Putative secreted protein n=1 Tax=Amblyomma triste TaxID=251400 RepID=A0A023G3S9_AMBTT
MSKSHRSGKVALGQFFSAWLDLIVLSHSRHASAAFCSPRLGVESFFSTLTPAECMCDVFIQPLAFFTCSVQEYTYGMRRGRTAALHSVRK